MTPDNGIFATVAYICAAIVYTGYALTLMARERSLRAKLGATEGVRR